MNAQAAPYSTLRSVLAIARRADSKFIDGEEGRARDISFAWAVHHQSFGGSRLLTPYLTRKLHG